MLNLSALPGSRENRYLNNALWSERAIGAAPTSGASGPNYFTTSTNDWYPKPGNRIITMIVYFACDVNTPTNFVIKWRGDCSISFINAVTASGNPTGQARSFLHYRGSAGTTTWNAGTYNVVSTNGRLVWTMPISQRGGTGPVPFASSLVITSGGVGSIQISDLVICRADEEDLYDTGQNVRPQWTSVIKGFSANALRMMDPQFINDSLLANWADRPPMTQVNYFTTQLNSNHVVGAIPGFQPGWIIGPTASAGTDTYQAAAYPAMPVSLTHNDWFQGFVQFKNNNATVMIDSGGRGPKPVVNQQFLSPALTTNGANTTGLATNNPHTFVYDKYVGGWILHNLGLPAGSPIETLVEICNVSGTPGWFNIPFSATNAGDPGISVGQDFVTLFAKYLVANYTLSTVYIEFANEVWNSLFSNTARAGIAGSQEIPGMVVGNPGAYNQWHQAWNGYYGLRMRQVASVLRPILGPKLKMVLAWGGGAFDPTTLQNERFKNSNYPLISGANAPYLQMDVASYASYFAGDTMGADLTGDGGQWKPGGTQGAADLAGAKGAVDNFVAGNTGAAYTWMQSDMYANNRFDNGYKSNFFNGAVVTTGRFYKWDNMLKNYNVPLMMYEGNHEINGPAAAYCISTAPWNTIPNMAFQSNPFSVISSVTAVSSRSALPTGVGAGDKIVVWVQPNSGLDIYVAVGDSTVTATLASRKIPAGTGATRGWATFVVPAGGTNFAAISTGSAGRIYAIKVAAGVPDDVISNFAFANNNDPTVNSAIALNPLAGVTSQSYPIYFGSTKLQIINGGTANVFVKLGDSTVVATTSDQTLQPGQWVALDVGVNTFVAILGTAATQQCYVSGGTGTIVSGTTGFNLYGGSKGQIEQAWRGFIASAQYLAFTEDFLTVFYTKYTTSRAGCLFEICTQPPWLTFMPLQSLQQFDSVFGSISGGPFQNWVAHSAWNNNLVSPEITQLVDGSNNSLIDGSGNFLTG